MGKNRYLQIHDYSKLNLNALNVTSCAISAILQTKGWFWDSMHLWIKPRGPKMVKDNGKIEASHIIQKSTYFRVQIQ